MKKNNKKMALILIFAIFFVSLDRFLKILAGRFSADLVGSVLKFHFAPNPYIAFSLPLTGLGLNIIIVVIILILIYFCLFLMKTGRGGEGIILVFIILAAVSNLVDRLRFGYVVDYFDLKYFTVFNLADVMIVGGAISWLIFKLKTAQSKRQP